MAFHKGNVPLKKSGATQAVRMRLKKGDIKEITIPRLEELMTEMGLEFNNRKVVSNILLRLLQTEFLKKTDVYDGRYKVYTVTVAEELRPDDEKPSYPTQECRILSGSEITPAGNKSVRELEDQLLVEKQKNEDLEAKIQDLMADHREEVSRLNKLLSEDRQMIGSLQKKVRELEIDNRAMRIRLQKSSEKVDMRIFNLPELPRLKGK